jgi:hypothetical protein
LIGRRDRLAQAGHLGVDVIGLDVVARLLDQVAADQEGPPDRDAGRDRHPGRRSSPTGRSPDDSRSRSRSCMR